MYADDIQLYVYFDAKIPGDAERAIARLRACIEEIRAWMTRNKLQLNDGKTEFFISCSSYNERLITDIPITIGDTTIHPSSSIKNLGVMFDRNMSMSDHVNVTIRTVNFHLRNIRRIRRFITVDTCHHLVRSLVLSRLDYCNSLLHGITVSDQNRLQTLQNRAARIIFKSDRRTPSVPLLRKLHWLPIESRIIFKLMLFIFKRFHGLLPLYLTDFVPQYIPNRPNLRSGDDTTLLKVPRTHRVAGDKSFHAAAPRLWNSLPKILRQCNTIDSFKKGLKTHLFPKS